MDKNDSPIFNKFETQDQVLNYINRSKDKWADKKGKYDFEQCHFNCDFILREFRHFRDAIFYENVSFKNSMFNENVSFEGITFKDTADFNGCIFKKNTSFKNVTFEKDVNFHEATFEKKVFFNESEFKGKVNAWKMTFLDDVNFHEATFEKKVLFNESEFKGKVNAWKMTFLDDVNFHEATFKKKVLFNESEFKGKVNAWKMTFLDDVTFKWSDFRKKANFSELKVKKSFVEFHGSNFESNAYFYDSEINKLDLKASVVDNGLFFLGANINTLNRETARIIKNEFVKQNNKIESLKYHAREMEAYKTELTENKEPYSCWDYWILKLNECSNDYGLNPGKGIKFTLSVSLVCFFVYYLSLKEYPITFSSDCTMPETFSSWGTVASHFIEFINPTHKASFLIDYIGSWSIFIDYFSRIIIGFGIYQLIQSFRKYGRV